MPTETAFLGGVIFGAIGFGALIFGKAAGSAVKMLLGGALLACSYLIDQAWLLWTCGALLTLLLLRWRE